MVLRNFTCDASASPTFLISHPKKCLNKKDLEVIGYRLYFWRQMQQFSKVPFLGYV